MTGVGIELSQTLSGQLKKEYNGVYFNSEILRLPGHSVEQLLGMHKPGIVCC